MSPPDDDPRGDWPQRLLHVPTMTSFEWQPGNRYGSYRCPQYNALSYTWGRWKLDDEVMTDIKAIEVSGVPWLLPRIDPTEHFTAEAFFQVIQKAIEPVPILLFDENQAALKGRYIDNMTTNVEFLWVDVACIDQDFPAWAMREIGRQIKIFHGACRTFIWLNHSTALDLERAMTCILELKELTAQRHHRHESQPTTWHATGIERIVRFLKEPWLSSLWTLQEAFLCPGALLMSQEGAFVSGKALGRKDPIRLSNICHWCKDIYHYCAIGEVSSRLQTTSLLSEIERSGLLELADDNPLALYIMAQKRNVSKEVDHIYGIMQIFDLQLGSSAPGAHVNYLPSLEELEQEFGVALLLKYPILSQLHVHTVNSELGKGWLVSRTSEIPHLN
ncbi:hypothetical protein BP5796_12044 [Coleophoma crateriformis]|uniref:Heterokaryon incompatibility domain-containing protein n=1 Tax=Coleophoma crateriformis TaxID=565419 RepID=A0A3D8QBU8_9HELO|nr:hypothetical protein BP5796_12044 [Coleophoma crateriformis]